MPDDCYARTVGGTPCELPAGHYPGTHHRITYFNPRGFMAWTDEAMADFARIAAQLDTDEVTDA